jgi:small subunit ribosomal protein S17
MTNQTRGKRKTRVGTVDSVPGAKTAIVEVGRVQRHPRYDKVISARTRCYVHDEQGRAEEGDTVRIEECRPMSRLKRWRLVEIVKKGRGLGGPAATEAEVQEIEESIRGPREKGPVAAAADAGGDRDPSVAGEAGRAPGGAAS